MSKFTYANVMSTVAAFLALGGSAYAAKTYVISSTKQISPKVLSKLTGVTGPAGAAGKAGLPGPAGTPGAPGAAGAAGAAGSAVAYGLVSDTGALTQSKGATVSHPSAGQYCIAPAAGVSFADKRALATLDFALSSPSAQINTSSTGGAGGCPAGTLTVRTFEITDVTTDGGKATDFDEGFYFLVP